MAAGCKRWAGIDDIRHCINCTECIGQRCALDVQVWGNTDAVAPIDVLRRITYEKKYGLKTSLIHSDSTVRARLTVTSPLLAPNSTPHRRKKEREIKP